jgi:hypothetical protein
MVAYLRSYSMIVWQPSNPPAKPRSMLTRSRKVAKGKSDLYALASLREIKSVTMRITYHWR